MNPLVIVALSIAGGLGAVARLVLDGFLRSQVKVAFPLGTTVINVTGSLLLGLITGLALTHAMPTEWRLILGTGFLGGYTTFSTASFETVRLAQAGRYVAALGNGLGMFAVALLAAGAGLWLGSLPW
ncbi:fluoride efflux transporter CrcB [Parafrigoribacterium mesophilum]|uniref:fluoride efflux transporter CrcB n=1 Tax=Parafrigoribacterium mesophilum TaxID=433646 RepID=UPI0031FCFB8E